MKKSIIQLLLLGTLSLSAQNTARVNPFIGTSSMGHVFPGAVAPHGLVALSPDTDTIPHNMDGIYQKDSYRYCAGYQYDDPTIVGFSHTHFSGTGHSDLGDLLIMPTGGALLLTPGTGTNPEGGYRSRFTHATEKAHPGYYAVTLDDYGIDVELTATERVGAHRYTYPEQQARFILDLVHGIYNYDGKVLWASVRVENPQLITGYRITNGWARENYQYFAISLSQPIANYGYEEFEKVNYAGGWRKFDMKHNFPEIAGRKIRAYFEFDLPASKQLEVRLAFSGVSTEGALKNLKAEAPMTVPFDQLAEATAQKWNGELNTIEAEGTNDQLAMLYTSLYHCKINPSVYQDVDGKYRGLDGNTHQADGFTNYTVFSLWDTYRALHPLMNIIDRKRSTDFSRSMLAHREQSVHKVLPMWSHFASENWCMIGYHGVSVLSDALAKGIDLDTDQAIEAMVSSSTLPYFDKTAEYIKYGYVPFEDSPNGVSLTLEYAYDDWCIYRAALAAGNMKVAKEYLRRAQSYRNVFDKSLGFSRARMRDGSWKNDFSLLNTHGEGYIEGNSINYSFYVPHDPLGMIELMGGDAKFVENLDSLFTMYLPDEFFAHTEDVTREGLLGGYVHGNEPSHHVLYLYNYTSQPWKTQYWAREVMNRMYRNEIDGLCGNDDCGQMSAWYIFTALGFYPVCPGSDQLVLGAPYLPYMKLNLGAGKTFEVKAPGVSDKNRYVKSVQLNGKPYTKGYITNSDVTNGGVLEFEMSAKPNKKRVFKGSDLPYSLSTPNQWSDYNVGEVKFLDQATATEGSAIYNTIIPEPQSYITESAREVLDHLYFSPADSIPGIETIEYRLRDYDGVSAKSGAPPGIAIDYSTRWIEKSYLPHKDIAYLHYETKGVLMHELVHGFQLEPQGIGNYGNSKEFRAMIEGVADAVRYMSGYFKPQDCPKGGTYMDGYRTTGFFLAWITRTKDKDFLRKFNGSALTVVPWSFDGAVKYALGDAYSVDLLWKEYKETAEN